MSGQWEREPDGLSKQLDGEVFIGVIASEQRPEQSEIETGTHTQTNLPAKPRASKGVGIRKRWARTSVFQGQ